MSSYRGAATLGNTVSAAGPMTLTGVMPCFDNMLTCLEVCRRLLSFRRVTSSPHRSIFEKCRDPAPFVLQCFCKTWTTWWTFRALFIFICSRRGTRESEAPRGWGSVFYWKSHGGGSPGREGPRGWEGVCSELGAFGGRGLTNFFRAEMSTKKSKPFFWLESVYTPPMCVTCASHVYHDAFAEVSGSGVVGTLPNALVPDQSVKMRLNSRKPIDIDLLTRLGATIVDRTFREMFCSQKHAILRSMKHAEEE